MMNALRPAVSVFVLLTLLTGVAYPLLTTLLGNLWFQNAAQGSLLIQQGEARGSRLIGQDFTRADYFHGRPSAAGEKPYNALASSGSNLAASNPALDEAIRQRVSALRAANPQATGAIPTDSASGLDPDISPAAALWQLPRVTQARQLPTDVVARLIAQSTTQPLMRFIGEPVVNVLQLNMALDALDKH
jgi:K+-transporting ATPase ATPase C chain